MSWSVLKYQHTAASSFDKMTLSKNISVAGIAFSDAPICCFCFLSAMACRENCWWALDISSSSSISMELPSVYARPPPPAVWPYVSGLIFFIDRDEAVSGPSDCDRSLAEPGVDEEKAVGVSLRARFLSLSPLDSCAGVLCLPRSLELLSAARESEKSQLPPFCAFCDSKSPGILHPNYE